MNINSISHGYEAQITYQNKKVSERGAEGGFAKELSSQEVNQNTKGELHQLYKNMTDQQAIDLFRKSHKERDSISEAESTALAGYLMKNPEVFDKLKYDLAVESSTNTYIKGTVDVGGGHFFSFTKEGWIEAPNQYASLVVPGDQDKTLENIYNLFGHGNVTSHFYQPGQEPTLAEFYEMKTGKSLIEELKEQYNRV